MLQQRELGRQHLVPLAVTMVTATIAHQAKLVVVAIPARSVLQLQQVIIGPHLELVVMVAMQVALVGVITAINITKAEKSVVITAPMVIAIYIVVIAPLVIGQMLKLVLDTMVVSEPLVLRKKVVLPQLAHNIEMITEQLWLLMEIHLVMVGVIVIAYLLGSNITLVQVKVEFSINTEFIMVLDKWVVGAAKTIILRLGLSKPIMELLGLHYILFPMVA